MTLGRASERFRHTLEETRTPSAIPSDVRLLSGIDGNAVFDPGAGMDKLAGHIRQTVDWAACMEACQAAGATKAFELGPGSALARMMKDAIPAMGVHSLVEFRTLQGVEDWLGKSRA